MCCCEDELLRSTLEVCLLGRLYAKPCSDPEHDDRLPTVWSHQTSLLCSGGCPSAGLEFWENLEIASRTSQVKNELTFLNVS